MRKTLILVVLSFALLAAACGDDAETSVGADPDNSNTPDDNDLPDDSNVPADDVPAEPILGAGPYPIADLTVTTRLDPDADPTQFRLACLGDTATVTGDGPAGDAAAMCLALNQLPVRDRIVNGAPADQVCTEIYGGPEEATITGTLDGETIDTSINRANGCGIADWEMLSAFLSPI